MSLASERKGMAQAVAGYALMGVPAVAALLDMDDETARGLPLPWMLIGKRIKADPVDVAVYVLARKEGIDAAEYWSRYSEADVLKNARRWFRHARLMLEDAA